MKKKTGLGKGLGSLIPDRANEHVISDPTDADSASGRVLEISAELIEVNPHQPRTRFNPSDLEDLIASIKQFGIIQPLVVTKKNGGYQLIAGERRLRAAKMVGLDAVPVVIRTASEQEKLELALIENVQRQDLNAVEEARAYRALMDTFDLTQEDVAKRVGKSRSVIANAVRLLDLESEVLDALMEGEITRSHARALLAQGDPVRRHQMFLQMLSGDMTVRDAEQMATAREKTVSAPAYADPNMQAHQRSLESIFGTKVRIQTQPNGAGKIVLHYFSHEELYHVLDLMGTIAIRDVVNSGEPSL